MHTAPAWQILLVLLSVIATCIPHCLQAQAQPILPLGGATGTKFWLAFPKNDSRANAPNDFGFHISSLFDTDVTIYKGLDSSSFKVHVKAGSVTSVTQEQYYSVWAYEVSESEYVSPRSYRIASPLPISVYVMCGKYNSSDGYEAIPIHRFGKDHVISTYYDYSRQGRTAYPGGFGIVASEDNTLVTMELRGRGPGKTYSGRSIGDIWTATLNEGDTYFVFGEGASDGVFDITGTSVRADKPIGVFSYHTGTPVPADDDIFVDRSYLVEMTPPIEMLGTSFVSVEVHRNEVEPGAAGDVYRIVSTQPQTTWSAMQFDLSTGEKVASLGGTLDGPGEFVDVVQDSISQQLLTGCIIWSADKPVLISQITTSKDYSGDTRRGPLMTRLIPREEYGSPVPFLSARNMRYDEHIVTVTALANPSDPEYLEHLRSVRLNGVPVWNHPDLIGKGLVENRVDGDVHWTRIRLPNDTVSYVLTSDDEVRLAGSVVGYFADHWYGWTITGSRSGPYPYVDTLPPVFTEIPSDDPRKASLYNKSFLLTELRNIPDPPALIPNGTDQIESGLRSLTLEDHADNAKLVLLTDDNFPFPSPHKTFSFRVDVDSTRNVDYTLHAEDHAGNRSTWSFNKQGAPKVLPSSHNYGTQVLNDKDTMLFSISNHTDLPITIYSVRLKRGDHYLMINQPTDSTQLQPLDSLFFRVAYLADRENNNLSLDRDNDTIVVLASSAPVFVPITGVAGVATMEVEDLDFGFVDPDGPPSVLEWHITNTGSLYLDYPNVSGHRGSAFSLRETDTRWEYPIGPKNKYLYGKVTYDPSHNRGDTVYVVVKSRNNQSDDTIAIWRGNYQGATGVVDDGGPKRFNVTWSSEQLTIEYDLSSQAHLVVVGVNGDVIVSHPLLVADTAVRVTTQDWASGTYVVAVIGRGQPRSQLIQITR